MRRRSRRHHLSRIGVLLVLNCLYFCVVQCLCDDENVKKEQLPSGRDRFPVFPFPTRTAPLNSTLSGKLRIIERPAPTPATRIVTTTTAKANSTAAVAIETNRTRTQDLVNLPASDQPFLENDHGNKDSREFTEDDELQTLAESSSIFGRALSRRGKSEIRTKARKAPSLSATLRRSGSYGYKPSIGSSGLSPIPSSSRPPTTAGAIGTFPTATVPILGGGGGGDEFGDYDGGGVEGAVPPFPSGGAPTSPSGGAAIGGLGGSPLATVVPILTPGTRSGGTTIRFGSEFDDEEEEARDYEDRDEEEGDIVPSALPPTRSSTPNAFSGRTGRARTRTRIVGFGSDRGSSGGVGTVKPIRRLVVGSGLRSTSTASSLPSLLRAAVARDREREEDDTIRDFLFSDIRCYRTRRKEYFGLTIDMKSDFHTPYIRDRPQDPLTSSSCRMSGSGTRMQMTITDLRGCGVEQCGDGNMCLTMVFPKVPSLALAEDEVTTIRCTPQKGTMSEVRTISFQGDSLDDRRSSSTVEGGTQDFAAEIGVFRQNSGSNAGLFVKRVNSGGVVKLGEPLQLRSVVRGGDGWQYSKLTNVKVWRMRHGYQHGAAREGLDPADATEVMTLVDSRGCRNSEYRLIAEEQPVRDPSNDLVHHFTFKAFLFRGQRANEPLIVTARVQACQEPDECILSDCASARALEDDLEEEGFLKDAPSPPPSEAAPSPSPEEASAARVRRSPAPVEIRNVSRIVHDWNSHMALRVVGPQDTQFSLDSEEEDYEHVEALGSSCVGKMVASTFTGALVMLLCCALGLGTVAWCKHRRCFCRAFDGGGAEEQFHFQRPPSGCSGGSKRTVIPVLKMERGAHNKQQLSRRPLPPRPKGKLAPISTPNSTPRSGARRCRSEIQGSASSLEESGEEYECIQECHHNERRSSGRRSRKEAAVVHFHENGKKAAARSTSAPPASRACKCGRHVRQAVVKGNKSRHASFEQLDSASQEEEDAPGEEEPEEEPVMDHWSAHSRTRRTVRSVKGRSSKRTARAAPVALPTKIIASKPTAAADDRFSISSISSSAEDSAYSGSTRCSDVVRAPMPSPGSADDSVSDSMTHFVTRNESSTQIIIFPETKV